MRKAAYLWLATWYGLSLFALTLDIPFHLPLSIQPGYDVFGRPLLWLVLQGSAISSGLSLIIGSCTLLIGITVGCLLATLPAQLSFYSGKFLDFFLAFPSLLISITLAALISPGWKTLVAAMVLGTLPGMIRLVQVRAREIIQEDFMTATRALGASFPRLVMLHFTPHLWHWIRVKIPDLFAAGILAEATLTLMGLGAPVGKNTWGALILQGKDYLIEAPSIAITTCIPLFLSLLSLQILLRDFDRRS